MNMAIYSENAPCIKLKRILREKGKKMRKDTLRSQTEEGKHEEAGIEAVIMKQQPRTSSRFWKKKRRNKRNKKLPRVGRGREVRP